MKIYYSVSRNGFFASDLQPILPDDGVEITANYHHQLLAGQASGQRIVADADGYPVLADPPGPTEIQLAEAVRAERDARIQALAWRVQRYESEVRLGLTPTDDITDLDATIQALRDVPKQAGFPAAVDWPEPATTSE